GVAPALLPRLRGARAPQGRAHCSAANLSDPPTGPFSPRHSSPLLNLLECTCVPLKLLMPGYSGRLGTALMPVANTRCLGCSLMVSPLRWTVTSHSCAASFQRAVLHSVPDQ